MKLQAILARRFDGSLNGLSFTEFMILSCLSEASDEKMRRIDLAEKIGLTASGVTRLLIPMGKIGLVKREMTEHDARVRFVTLASGGKAKLQDALERAQRLSNELIPSEKRSKIQNLSKTMTELMGTIR